MATADVLHQPEIPQALFKPVIQKQGTKRKLDDVEFHPDQHLAFEQPKRIITMSEIGYDEGTGVSPVAVSEPFRLFSTEAIQKFRDEALSDEVLSNHMYKSNLGACYLRGFVPKYAPFILSAWHNPRVLEIVSEIAGVELVPQMDYEIAHINILVKSEKEANQELAMVERERRPIGKGKGTDARPWEDDKPVVGWHNDGYPFVCVTMLSDCTKMVGGETALRKANGGVVKVRGPQMGCAVVMHGRHITHQALRSLGAEERITMVTSFRPKSHHLPDDADLHTVRGISDMSEVYYQFGKYRFQILEARIQDQLRRLELAHAADKTTDLKAMKRFLHEQEHFLKHMNSEMVPEEEIVAGRLPELDIPDEPGSEVDGR